MLTFLENKMKEKRWTKEILYAKKIKKDLNKKIYFSRIFGPVKQRPDKPVWIAVHYLYLRAAMWISTAFKTQAPTIKITALGWKGNFEYLSVSNTLSSELLSSAHPQISRESKGTIHSPFSLIKKKEVAVWAFTCLLPRLFCRRERGERERKSMFGHVLSVILSYQWQSRIAHTHSRLSAAAAWLLCSLAVWCVAAAAATRQNQPSHPSSQFLPRVCLSSERKIN
jgi:hypothetical protein